MPDIEFCGGALEAISGGEFATAGFRNRDLRLLLPPKSAAVEPVERRKVAAHVSRRLRTLRAHGLITKIPKSQRPAADRSAVGEPQCHGQAAIARGCVAFAARREEIPMQ